MNKIYPFHLTVFFLSVLLTSLSCTEEKRTQVNGEIKRIISLSPSETEMVCMAGACDRLVGRTRFGNWPPQARDVQVVGVNPLNLEQVIALDPDLVLLKEGMVPVTELEKLKELGINTRIHNYRNVRDVFANLDTLGKLFGTEKVTSERSDSLERIYQQWKTRKYERRPRTIMLISPDLYIYGGSSYATELLELAGGENAAGKDLANPFPKVGREYLLSLDPEVILAGEYFDYNAFFDLYPELKNVKAYREKQLFHVDQDLVSRPGPKVLQGVEAINRLLHD